MHRIKGMNPIWWGEKHGKDWRAGENADNDLEDVDYSIYVEKVEDILSAPPCLGVPPDPSEIAPGVYLGTAAQGENIALLKGFKIHNVINVNGLPLGCRKSREARYKDTGIKYYEFPLEDGYDSQIWQYFKEINNLINALKIRGRVIICDPAVSRGGAVALCYLIRNGSTLLKATKFLKSVRRVLICNTGFVEQVVQFAAENRMLDPEPQHETTYKFGGKIDKYRMYNSHLPQRL